MKLTAFTDYSLPLLAYLALQPQRRATQTEGAAELAECARLAGAAA